MAKIEAQLKTAKDKNGNLEQQIPCLRFVNTNTVKSNRFEPKGKLYNLVPQNTSNFESYQKLLIGVKDIWS